jgi:hypothetical protein
MVKGVISSFEPIVSRINRVSTRYVLCICFVSGCEKGYKERVRGGCGRGIMEEEEAEPDVKPQLSCMYEQSQSLHCIVEMSFIRDFEQVHSDHIEPSST